MIISSPDCRLFLSAGVTSSSNPQASETGPSALAGVSDKGSSWRVGLYVLQGPVGDKRCDAHIAEIKKSRAENEEMKQIGFSWDPEFVSLIGTSAGAWPAKTMW
ncbi:hypothetical protein PZN02_005285 [Sinorhizobium garamanticum]|uniref:Uncharacterized protein n=1 Tax=Sinorhizobium garamanticum TaxID=680247 RepID=A0ABY8DIC8_9HYPH|nr:hypothetical protein [Sinorhizobium garamanticum]WEX89948.1 hypothetical protein PZN02_005285 [Sinorhizobium garamanticum]